jgi:hypothetical protein
MSPKRSIGRLFGASFPSEIGTPPTIIGGEFRKDPPQVLFVEHDQMIGTLAPDRPDQAFNMADFAMASGMMWADPDPIAWMRRVNTRPKARSLSRTIYVGARSQGNASVIWRANHSAVGQRDRNKALFLFDQDSFLLRALGATEYALLVTGRVGRLNAIKPHTPAAVRTRNRLLDCLR